ncbi:TonB-dependent receptor [Mucilaginibacter sabulilitoris]|uniref:TonB-dependent receptor n=1 Tax=Mucilaginibacter sabulilitoris TaxID=1173583 RepID=A0ABZ0TIR9_9SPHI|nr:TonB-dependent receptor [Mucilaginibacter sabulilitoris]WPU92694.1 TonB-dependent receptor [Mucilaginibacter sabulilitoris]
MKNNVIKHIILALVPLLISQLVFAQQRISGVVKNNIGDAIPFAGISIKSSGEGTKTDSAGKFSILTKATGKQILLVTSVGYKSLRKEITIADSAISLDLVMEPNAQSLNEVIISAGSFEASDKAKGASLTAMDAFTVAGNNADIALALRSLPGAQQIGEREGLFVRGGTGDETRQFIDGMLVKNPNYPAVPGLQQYARINPSLFSGILFSSGGYSALYGQAMSSALIMESVDLPDKSSGSFHVFSAGMGVGMQKLARNKKSSYGVSLSYNNQAWYNAVISQRVNYFSGPVYLGGDANFRIKTGKTGMLKFYTNWSTSDVGMRNPDIDSAALRSGYQVKGTNVYNNLSYRDYLNNDWKLDAGVAYSYNRVNIIQNLTDASGQIVNVPKEPFNSKNYHRLINTDFAQGRIVFTRMLPHNQALRFGGEHFYSKDHGMSNDTTIALTDNLTAAFAEGDIYLANNLAAKVGVRAEHSSLLSKWEIAPRASLAYRLPDGGQFNLAYGVFYQEPQNEYLYQTTDLNFSRAAHYVLNYTKKAHNRFFRVEAYYKKYHDLLKTDPAISTTGKGYARGIELFFRDKKSIKNLDYWISYTYLDTKRDYLNYPDEIKPTFAAPHTATAAIKKSFPEINTYLNISYAFATGRPYYNIRYNNPDKAYHIYDQGTTKGYNVINLQLAYLISLFKSWKQKPFSGVSIGVNNLLGTNQVFGYNYNADGSIKLPITLPAARYVYAGFFMSFGIDRTSDILDNNLN